MKKPYIYVEYTQLEDGFYVASIRADGWELKCVEAESFAEAARAAYNWCSQVGQALVDHSDWCQE